jgi:pimeloyl-ACP methyl ester carboxylesterase
MSTVETNDIETYYEQHGDGPPVVFVHGASSTTASGAHNWTHSATSTLLVVAGAALFLQDDEGVTWRLADAALVVAIGVSLVVQA